MSPACLAPDSSPPGSHGQRAGRTDERLPDLPLDERQLLRAGAELAAEHGSFGVDDLAMRLGADFDELMVALGRLRRESLIRETGRGDDGTPLYAVSIEGLQRLED